MKELNVKEFLDLTIEEIFADRFARYSKYIIQDRALPDVRDGLKPVQRRILYAMHQDGNTFNKSFRKSAKTIGNVIGNYHPHGDSSVYEAMVRTSQTWKVNEQLVIMHGNNGSIDGDNAAAMRYTEAKMSKYAEVMMQDINEDTVMMIPNFDDTELEPTVLPTKIPNLLINGASGISAGYATDIPPHNPEEIIKAAILINDKPKTTLEEIMEIVPGPDFPTGATIQGKEGIKKAYETGKGKIVIKSNYKIKGNDIIVSAIPYEVNKATLLQRIELIKYEKKVSEISEVIDQSDQNVLEILISCKKDADKELIIKYLLKHTDLQKNYNFNMIAINNRRPEQLGIETILRSFIEHRKDVITRRSVYRLKKAQAKIHILEGMIKAVDILDEIIAVIRLSKNKGDSKNNLIEKFSFSQEQAEAIVMMQLYRLSNTDMENLKQTFTEVIEEIAKLEKILNSKQILKRLISKELKEVLKEINHPRRTTVEDNIDKIEIDKNDLIKEEKTIVSISKMGYIKRSNVRSYNTTNKYSVNISGDQTVGNFATNTKEKLLVFLNDGTYIQIPVYEIPDVKWKDLGLHISSMAKINDNASVVGAITIKEYTDYHSLITVTKKGYAIHVRFPDLETSRSKSKVMLQKLKTNDEVVSLTPIKQITNDSLQNQSCVFITTEDRYVSVGIDNFELGKTKRIGKKVARLKNGEEIVYVHDATKELLILTNKGGYVKYQPKELFESLRLTYLYNNFKTNWHEIIKCYSGEINKVLLINEKEEEEILEIANFKDVKIGEKLKTYNKTKNITNIENIIE